MRRLHPATIIVAILPRLREAVQAAIPLLIGSCATGHGHNQEWSAIAIAVLTGVYAIGGYFTTRFGVEPGHVVHQTGWIFKKDRRIPLDQIQNVNLRQNVLERLFKVATLDVETAMGKGRDLKLSVLGIADAEKFREELLGAAHLDAPDSTKVAEPLLTLTRHDLMLGAVTENHLPQMMVFMVTLTGPTMGAVARYVAALPVSVGSFVVAGAVALLFLGSWLWGVVSYFLKYGGFMVRVDENAFRISYGLLNKIQNVIRPNRIEYLHITATLPQRWMNRATFKVGTASTFGEAGVAAAPIALFVERERAYASAAGILPGLDVANLPWRQFAPVFYRAALVRSAVWLALLFPIAYCAQRYADVSFYLAWTVYGLVSALFLSRTIGMFLSMAENSFAITKDALVVRYGYLNQSISAIPIGRMENISVTKPRWWTRYHASVLSVQAMKNRVGVRGMADSSIEELLANWREKIDELENSKLIVEVALPGAELLEIEMEQEFVPDPVTIIETLEDEP